MSILGNRWCQGLGSVATAIALSVILSACGARDENHNELQEVEEPRALTDTTDPQHVPADSTLHKVQEVRITVKGDEVQKIEFDTDTIEVMAGALVKISLKNEGTEQSMIHNIVIVEEGQYEKAALEGAKVGSPGKYIPKDVKVIAASSLALPGQTVEVKFQAPLNPVTYDFVCTYPEHYQRMHGKVIVK